MTTISLSPAHLAMFQSRIQEDANGCHLWMGTIDDKGYGRLSVRRIGTPLAHRISYMLAYGEIPDGMWIDHICHTRNCVNPEHLRVATAKQNAENRKGSNRDNGSGMLGVSWHKGDKRWYARVIHAGVLYRLGAFHTAEEADHAVVAKRNELYTHNDRDRVAS